MSGDDGGSEAEKPPIPSLRTSGRVGRRTAASGMQPTTALAGRQPHKRVGAYDLYDCIGQGSFASVFRACVCLSTTADAELSLPSRLEPSGRAGHFT